MSRTFQNKNVTFTLLQALSLCTGRTARRSRGIAIPFHDHGTRSGRGVSVTPRQLFTPRKDPVPILQEAGWATGSVWIGAENLAPTGIRSPDRPSRNQSLYLLRYLAHIFQNSGWAPGSVWIGAENLAPTGIRSPDRPSRSQSLYRLRYLAHIFQNSALYSFR